MGGTLTKTVVGSNPEFPVVHAAFLSRSVDAARAIPDDFARILKKMDAPPVRTQV
jgi:hypothetical protein